MEELREDALLQLGIFQVPGEGVEAVGILDQMAAHNLPGPPLDSLLPIVSVEWRGRADGTIRDAPSASIGTLSGQSHKLPIGGEALLCCFPVSDASEFDQGVADRENVSGESMMSPAVETE